MKEEVKAKRLSKVQKIAGIFSLFFILYLCYHFIDWGFFNGEITEYPVQCKQKVVLGVCDTPDYALSTTTYKPSEDRQEVLSWIEGEPVERYKKCAVKDRENWQCSYDDNSATFGFTNGNYWFVVNSQMATTLELTSYDKEYYVSKLEWMKLKCDGWSAGFNRTACLLL